VNLIRPAPADLVAAVVAAQAWCLVFGAETLEHPQRYGRQAVVALGRVCVRAGGHSTDSDSGTQTEATAAPTEWFVHAEQWAEWATSNGVPRSVLAVAAQDLGGCGDPRLDTMAAVLQATAE